jgi:uncharacterized protein
LETPCIGLCTIDTRHGRCLGCGRTVPEIASWSRFTSAERQRIMGGLASRLLDTKERDALLRDKPNPPQRYPLD